MLRSIRAMLAGGGDGGEDHESDQSTRSLDETIRALKGTADRVASANPFRVGDLVTVREDSDVKGKGEPHVVVEVFDPPVVDQRAEPGSNQYLRRFDLRVAHYMSGSQTIHAIDHAVLEPWSEHHAEQWSARAKSQQVRHQPTVSSDTPFAEIIRQLREAGQRQTSAKIDWKKGEIVEIVGHEVSGATKPMRFDGRAVGYVETVDRSDDTTHVCYYGSSGTLIRQWFKPMDLAVYRSVGPVPED